MFPVHDDVRVAISRLDVSVPHSPSTLSPLYLFYFFVFGSSPRDTKSSARPIYSPFALRTHHFLRCMYEKDSPLHDDEEMIFEARERLRREGRGRRSGDVMNVFFGGGWDFVDFLIGEGEVLLYMGPGGGQTDRQPDTNEPIYIHPSLHSPSTPPKHF